MEERALFLGAMVSEQEEARWSLRSELNEIAKQGKTACFIKSKEKKMMAGKQELAENLYMWSSTESRQKACENSDKEVLRLLAEDRNFAYEMLMNCRNEFSLQWCLERGAGNAINLQSLGNQEYDNQKEAMIHHICDLSNPNFTPLNRLKMVKCLVEKGADANLASVSSGFSPLETLEFAMKGSKDELLEYLLSMSSSVVKSKL